MKDLDIRVARAGRGDEWRPFEGRRRRPVGSPNNLEILMAKLRDAHDALTLTFGDEIDAVPLELIVMLAAASHDALVVSEVEMRIEDLRKEAEMAADAEEG